MVGTKRNDVVAVLEAYHGWTYLSDAVLNPSSSFFSLHLLLLSSSLGDHIAVR